MQIACVLQAGEQHRRDYDFRVEACNVQAVRDFAGSWVGKLPGGDEPWPCVDYQKPPADPKLVHPIFEMTDIGAPDALGYHDDELDFVYGRTLLPGDSADATTLSHEACEMRADPTIDLWLPYRDGLEVAVEACDAVEADRYPVSVTVAGEHRTVWVSNFVLPAWFVDGSAGPWDFMRLLSGPKTMTEGGYLILRDPATGETHNVFADGVGTRAGGMSRRGISRKLVDPHSRTYRRVRGPHR